MKEEIRDLLSKGKLDKALKLALGYTEKTKQNDEHKCLNLLCGRLTRNETKYHSGLLGNDDYTIENNRINSAFLSYLCEIDFSQNVVIGYNEQNTSLKNVVVALDPIAIQHQLTRERLNVPSEFTSLSKLGSDVLTFLKEKTNFTENERLFVRNFQNLQWAFDDFKQRNSEANAKILIDELKNQQQLILSFLVKAAKETPIERLFQDAKEASYETFVEKYRLYLEKAVTLKKVANDALEVFNNEFKELEVDYSNAIMAEIEVEDFKIKMIRRYGM